MKPVVTEEVVEKVQQDLDPERAQWVDVTGRLMNYNNRMLIELASTLLDKMTKYNGKEAHKMLDNFEHGMNILKTMQEEANQ